MIFAVEKILLIFSVAGHFQLSYKELPMRPVSIDQVSENDILARPIYDIEGRRLLNSGVSLRPSIVQKLHEKGISSVYIDDEISEGIEVEGILCEETRTRARLIVKEEMQRLSQKSRFDTGRNLIQKNRYH